MKMVMNAVNPNNHINSIDENTFQHFDLESLNFRIIVDGETTGWEYSLIESTIPQGER